MLIALWGVGSFPYLFAGKKFQHYSEGITFDLRIFLVVAIGALVLQLVASGALYRIALFGPTARKEGLGFGGLQLWLPELRLFLGELIISAFLLLIMAAVLVVFSVSFNTAGMMEGHADTGVALLAMVQRHQGVDWIFIGFLIAAWLFLIFAGLKFSLFRAATIAERKIVTLNALGLSSGNVGKLFLGLLLFVAPFVILSIVVAYHLGPQSMAFGPSLVLIAHAGLQAVGIFIMMPLLVGFLSSAYRQITAMRAK